MKKFLFIALSLFFAVNAFAQHATGTFSLQPKIGLNISTLTKEKIADSRVGFSAGVEGEYQLSDVFSVSVGLLYSQQGAKYDVENGNFTEKLDYVNIPIMANVYVVKGLAIKLGVQPGFNVHENSDLSVNSVDFTIPVGLSYEYANFVLDGRYNWGLTNVYKDGKEKNSVFQITLGYRFDL